MFWKKGENRSLECGSFVVKGFAIIAFSALAPFASAQVPDATPDGTTTESGFKISSSIELGVRGRDVNGSDNKYRSDFNYKSGFRVFDSSFLIENTDGSSRLIDSLLVTTSGWGSDPSGSARIIAEKVGYYRVKSTVRRVNYFNNLNNYALGQHTRNSSHNMADLDATLFPQDEKFRITFGVSTDKSKGPGTWTVRFSGDEFGINSFTNTRSSDARVGIEGKLLGFNYHLGQGFRRFQDRSNMTWEGPNSGNNTTGTASMSSFYRELPVDGDSYFTNFGVQRTFAKSLDITARGIYTSTATTSSVYERITGRDGSNNQVDLDQYFISGDSRRIQFRGDFGISWRATDKFTISETVIYDTFGIDGGMSFEQQLARRNAAGNPLVATFVRQKNYRVNDYRRFANTIEGDYQFNSKVALNIGYRYTNRKVELVGFRQTLTSPPSPTNPLLLNEENDNQTHTLIAGMKIKPTRNWNIWWDVEHGAADNVFTRVSNYEFTNLRLRSRLTFNKLSLNLSAISKDNTNPSQTFDEPPVNFGVDSKVRIFSSSLDWSPNSTFYLSTGYTYEHQTSETAILSVIEQPNLTRPRIRGLSQYFVRDNYFFVDATAQPVRRLSLFGSYRFNKDKGQGNLVATGLENIISSYPMQLKSPEFRAAIRLTRNIDWNIGYQYFDYKELFPQSPSQNYNAHLPYTSLRIYFGGRSGDR